MVAPVLEELSDEYKDKLIIYKVDTEKEMELSGVFESRVSPLFIYSLLVVSLCYSQCFSQKVLKKWLRSIY